MSAPVSDEAAAFVSLGRYLRLRWASARTAALAGLPAHETANAFWRMSEEDAQISRDRAYSGNASDANRWRMMSADAAYTYHLLHRYPHLWPVFAELLHDDAPHTWEARVAAKAAELYPGEGVEL